MIRKTFAELRHALMRIYQDVERSSDNSNDTRLLFEAKTKSTDCEKRLNKLKSRIEKVLVEFRMTPEGRVAREVKRDSLYIKTEAGLEIYKLPLSEVHQVNSGVQIKAVVKWYILVFLVLRLLSIASLLHVVGSSLLFVVSKSRLFFHAKIF